MLLRAIEPEDLDLMYLIENDRSLWTCSSHTAPFSMYQLKQYIQDSSADIYKDAQVRFAIADEVAGPAEALGFLDLENFDAKNMRAEVAIVLMKEAQHKGLALRALKEAMEYAEGLGMVQLYAVVAGDNAAAHRLFTAAGFAETATMKDWLLVNGNRKPAVLYQYFFSLVSY